jgi:hypothetical protein
MFSKRKASLIVSAAVAATLGGGLFLYVTPASTNVKPAPVDDRPAIANDAPYNPLSEDAVDAGPIVESWRDGGYTYYENR